MCACACVSMCLSEEEMEIQAVEALNAKEQSYSISIVLLYSK